MFVGYGVYSTLSPLPGPSTKKSQPPAKAYFDMYIEYIVGYIGLVDCVCIRGMCIIIYRVSKLVLVRTGIVLFGIFVCWVGEYYVDIYPGDLGLGIY